jgi:hypothetical protein
VLVRSEKNTFEAKVYTLKSANDGEAFGAVTLSLGSTRSTVATICKDRVNNSAHMKNPKINPLRQYKISGK